VLTKFIYAHEEGGLLALTNLSFSMGKFEIVFCEYADFLGGIPGVLRLGSYPVTEDSLGKPASDPARPGELRTVSVYLRDFESLKEGY